MTRRHTIDTSTLVALCTCYFLTGAALASLLFVEYLQAIGVWN